MIVYCFSYVAEALVPFCSFLLKLSEGMQIFSSSGWRSWIPYTISVLFWRYRSRLLFSFFFRG